MFRISYIGRSPLDFEAFGPEVQRSRVGALPLVPGAAVDVTESELRALEAAGVRLKIIASPVVATPVAPLAEVQTSAAKSRKKR